MTIATQEVLFGVASQTISVETDLPIVSLACKVYEATGDDTGTEEDAILTVAASGESDALTVPALAGTTALVVADSTQFNPSATGYARFVLTGADGLSEFVEVEGVDGDTEVYLRRPLLNDFAVGSTLTDSFRATASVKDAWAADLNNLSPAFSPNPRYRVKWTLIGANATRIVYTNLDLVRYSSAAIVSPIDVDDAFPGWLDRLPPDHRKSQGRALIAEAVRSVKLDLYHRGIADQALRNAEVHAALVIDRTILATAEDNALRGAPSVGALEMAQARYDRRLAGLVDSPRLALDTAGTGGAKTVEARRQALSRR